MARKPLKRNFKFTVVYVNDNEEEAMEAFTKAVKIILFSDLKKTEILNLEKNNQ